MRDQNLYEVYVYGGWTEVDRGFFVHWNKKKRLNGEIYSGDALNDENIPYDPEND